MSNSDIQVILELGNRAIVRERPTPEGFTHDWVIFVRGPNNEPIDSFIDKVVFYLHESFPKPKRVRHEAPFEVHESGYAGFLLPIALHFKNGESLTLHHDLILNSKGTTYTARQEKLTFQRPSDDFRRRLLKAGAVYANNDILQKNCKSKPKPPLSKSNKFEDRKSGKSHPLSKLSDTSKQLKEKFADGRNTFIDLFGTPIKKNSISGAVSNSFEQSTSHSRTKHHLSDTKSSTSSTAGTSSQSVKSDRSQRTDSAALSSIKHDNGRKSPSRNKHKSTSDAGKNQSQQQLSRKGSDAAKGRTDTNRLDGHVSVDGLATSRSEPKAGRSTDTQSRAGSDCLLQSDRRAVDSKLKLDRSKHGKHITPYSRIPPPGPSGGQYKQPAQTHTSSGRRVQESQSLIDKLNRLAESDDSSDSGAERSFVGHAGAKSRLGNVDKGECKPQKRSLESAEIGQGEENRGCKRHSHSSKPGECGTADVKLLLTETNSKSDSLVVQSTRRKHKDKGSGEKSKSERKHSKHSKKDKKRDKHRESKTESGASRNSNPSAISTVNSDPNPNEVGHLSDRKFRNGCSLSSSDRVPRYENLLSSLSSSSDSDENTSCNTATIADNQRFSREQQPKLSCNQPTTVAEHFTHNTPGSEPLTTDFSTGGASSIRSVRSTSSSGTTPDASMFTPEYLSELHILHRKIQDSNDNRQLRRVIELISSSGAHLEDDVNTYEFDLCALDQSVIKELQKCLLMSG